MKLRTLSSAFVLLTAACLAFTFKSAKRINIIWFTLNSGIQTGVGDYATLPEAFTNANYTYFGTSAPSLSSGNYFFALAADADKPGELVDPNETPDDLTDDQPNVSSSSSDVHCAISAAHNMNDTWSNVTTGCGNAQVKTKNTF
jgi:hypothetical protein